MNSFWQWDQALFRNINVGLHQNWLDPIFWVISSTGLGWVQATILLLSFPWKRVFRPNSKPLDNFKGLCTTKTPIQIPLILTWAVTGIVDQLVKHDVPRNRPSNLPWALPQETIYANSFASGHSATAFGIAFTIFFLTRGSRNARYGWLALAWAGCVGFSRIYRGVHWPSDVLSGFCLGLGCAAFMMLWYPERFKQEVAGDG